MTAVVPYEAGDVAGWAERIATCWQQSAAAIIETGRLIAAAKAALPHGEFTTMVESGLPFGSRTAQMLMAIANDVRLSNPKHVSLLPPSWGTLYELTKLGDDQFDAKLKDGTIRPELERRELITPVKQAHRAAKEAQLAMIQESLPKKKFGVILADPEWRFQPYSRDTGMDRAADNHYSTSATEVIAARPVADIAADDCVLFLWATVPMLPDALQVMKAWGFTYKSHCIWNKDRIGTGYWFRNKHELLLVGTRGNIPAPAMGEQANSVTDAPVGRHSAKPEAFLEMIEAYFPNLPKIELNRRGPVRKGWSAWGNEAQPGEFEPTTGEITDDVRSGNPVGSDDRRDSRCDSGCAPDVLGDLRADLHRVPAQELSNDQIEDIPAFLRRQPDNTVADVKGETITVIQRGKVTISEPVVEEARVG